MKRFLVRSRDLFTSFDSWANCDPWRGCIAFYFLCCCELCQVQKYTVLLGARRRIEDSYTVWKKISWIEVSNETTKLKTVYDEFKVNLEQSGVSMIIYEKRERNVVFISNNRKTPLKWVSVSFAYANWISRIDSYFHNWKFSSSFESSKRVNSICIILSASRWMNE